MAFLFGLILLLALVIAGLVWFTANTARRVEAMLPPRGQFMEIDGQRIHYVDTGGNKPPVVMIHGLGGNLLHFGYAMADKLSNDFRVILVDRPGSGYSTRPDDAPATLTAQAKTIATLIRKLGLGKPLVVGHSLGGALSLAIALDHPDCVGGLTLLAPLTHAQEEVPEVFKGIVIASPLVRKAIAWTVATPLGILRGQKLVAEVFAPEPAPADFPIRGGGILGLRPRAFYATSTDIMAVSRRAARLHRALQGARHSHGHALRQRRPPARLSPPWRCDEGHLPGARSRSDGRRPYAADHGAGSLRRCGAARCRTAEGWRAGGVGFVAPAKAGAHNHQSLLLQSRRPGHFNNPVTAYGPGLRRDDSFGYSS